MTYETLLTDVHQGVLTITLNRPQVMNAMNDVMFRELHDVMLMAAKNESANIIVLKGAGGNFSAGGDLMTLSNPATHEHVIEGMAGINEMIEQLHHMPKPVIAVIQGAAVGAGLHLALQADFVIADVSAVIQAPFVQIGLTNDFGGTYVLPRLVGMAQAKRLALLCDKISGKEAMEMGLIFQAVASEALEGAAEKVIAKLNRLPKQAFLKTKEGLNHSLSWTLQDALEWEKENQSYLIKQPELKQAIEMMMSKK
ncbi:enoyl-CoA hydratase/isomerase family protein [Longirhabdus pacifica]|uniref:enoyl-CoA hydratase/isomerase family protein n=1 Tax=Longirhabdus pacifica TaxID=2305227 RepID=UPI001F0B7DEB|nr:enoyl-CoA hydratase-related protein [Longirhabdus pacifica]